MDATGETVSRDDLIELAADIVSAYVSNNVVAAPDLSQVIIDVHAALRFIANGEAQANAGPQEPAVSPKRSVTPDHIICLEDGMKFKSLKRHLRIHHDLSPEEYRGKWGLSADYPIVAPNYSAARSALAKKIGLGQQRRRKER
jgi:predicted transcriptional regulator